MPNSNRNSRNNKNNNARRRTSGSQRKPKKNNKLKLRVNFLIFCMVSVLMFVGVFRVTSIKASKGTEFEMNAIENQINKVQDTIINPNRGSILDRNGQTLAISSTVFNVALDIRIMSGLSQESINQAIVILNEELEIPISQLQAYFEKNADGTLKAENDTHWKVISKQLPYANAKILEARLKEEGLIGVNLEEDTMRSYPHNNLASQTIGFIRGDTSWGLESRYDGFMTGTTGRIYRTYENDTYIDTSNIAPVKGDDIVTTLDFTIQQMAERIARENYENLSPIYTPEAIQILVMNPQTGEMLAIAEYPNFNVNNPNEISLLDYESYATYFDTLESEEQYEIKNSIWKNLAITYLYENGSTFKASVVAAGLEAGVVSTNENFYCGGYVLRGGYTIRCHLRSGHGNISLTESLAKSCNMVMIEIAERLGRAEFYEYQTDFGFGDKTGIDLYGEVTGSSFIVPISGLNSTELATSAFGQTFMSTPMQAIVAFAATINGGNVMQPYIVSQIVDNSGNIVQETQPHVLRKVISEDTSNYLREAMVTTLEYGGTGYSSNISGYDIGGKTGTAQQGDRTLDIYTLSFAAYMPAENPEYLVLAIIHKPDNYVNAPSGMVTPSVIIKEMMQGIINYKAIPPSNPDEKNDALNATSEDIVLNDYTDKALKDVIDELNRIGLEYQLVGGGGDTVVRQIPVANTSIDRNGRVLLYIESKNSEQSSLTAVPDTIGLGVSDASKLIEQMGFIASVVEFESLEVSQTNQSSSQSSDNFGYMDEATEEELLFEEQQQEKLKVFEQLPSSGVMIEKGSTIKIKVR